MWICATIAKTFHVLPTQAAYDLDHDPEQTAIEAVVLLNYADAKHAYDDAKDEEATKQLRKSIPLISTVEDIMYERIHARVTHREPVQGCRWCEWRFQ